MTRRAQHAKQPYRQDPGVWHNVSNPQRPVSMLQHTPSELEKPWTVDELLQFIDKHAREELKMSAEELIRKYQANEIEEPGEIRDLLCYIDLLPKDYQSRVGHGDRGAE